MRTESIFNIVAIIHWGVNECYPGECFPYDRVRFWENLYEHDIFLERFHGFPKLPWELQVMILRETRPRNLVHLLHLGTCAPSIEDAQVDWESNDERPIASEEIAALQLQVGNDFPFHVLQGNPVPLFGIVSLPPLPLAFREHQSLIGRKCHTAQGFRQIEHWILTVAHQLYPPSGGSIVQGIVAMLREVLAPQNSSGSYWEMPIRQRRSSYDTMVLVSDSDVFFLDYEGFFLTRRPLLVSYQPDHVVLPALDGLSHYLRRMRRIWLPYDFSWDDPSRRHSGDVAFFLASQCFDLEELVLVELHHSRDETRPVYDERLSEQCQIVANKYCYHGDRWRRNTDGYALKYHGKVRFGYCSIPINFENTDLCEMTAPGSPHVKFVDADPSDPGDDISVPIRNIWGGI